MSPEKLVHMINQIAIFMETGRGAAGVAAHVNDYWEPRMRRQLLELIAAGGTGMRPVVLDAAPMIRRPPEPERTDAPCIAGAVG